jgi:hypothetical protein
MNNIFKIDTAPVKHYTFAPYNKNLLDQDILRRYLVLKMIFLFGFRYLFALIKYL